MNALDFLGTDLEYDNDNQYIWGRRNGGIYLLGILKTLPSIEDKFLSEIKITEKEREDAMAFQNELGQLILEAIKEKIERDKTN